MPRYGSNSVLWSLSYEVWYYVAYPIVVYLSYRFGGIAAFGTSVLVSIGAWVLPGSATLPLLAMVSYWMTWCAGALLAEIWHGRFGRPRWDREALFAGGVGFAAFLGLDNHGSVGKALWIVATWLLMYGLIFTTVPGALRPATRRAVRVAQKLGDCSYTLYVIHSPIFVLVSAWWLSWHDALPATPVLAVCLLFAVLGLSIVAARFIEEPFKSRSARAAPARLDPN